MNATYERMSRAAASLSDDDLARALHAAEHCALCSTRNRKDMALLCVRCLRGEMDRRAATRFARPRTQA
jgi:hypothetical protein